MRLVATVTALLITIINGMASASGGTLVEVRSGGDDGLTQRLKVATEQAFESAPDFSLSRSKEPGTLVVTIPTNVRWKEVGGRTKIFYSVEFTSFENERIDTRKGSCWDDTVTQCADQIIKSARATVRKIH